MWHQDSFLSGSQSDLRQGNLTVVLQHIQRNMTLSRSNLAQITGLNRATITRLITDLTKSGFVRENGLEFSGSGRPSIPLEINPDAGYILSSEIGTHTVSLLLADFGQNILWRGQQTFAKGASPQEVIASLAPLVDQAREHIQDSTRPIYGMSVGVQGLVDMAHETLLFAPNLHWQNVPLRQRLEDALQMPVFIDNVASLSALGESYSGAAMGSPYALYISTQYGIGGRLIINNRVLRGMGGVAGEIGHMTIDINGKLCSCGKRGCWETLASQKAALDEAWERLGENPGSILWNRVDGQADLLSISTLVEAADAGDALATDILKKTGYYLGVGIANLINALNPQRVVIGGELSIAKAYLLPEIEAVVSEQSLQWSRENCEIVIAKHGTDATLMGGVALVHLETIQNLEQWVG